MRADEHMRRRVGTPGKIHTIHVFLCLACKCAYPLVHVFFKARLVSGKFISARTRSFIVAILHGFR